MKLIQNLNGEFYSPLTFKAFYKSDGHGGKDLSPFGLFVISIRDFKPKKKVIVEPTLKRLFSSVV